MILRRAAERGKPTATIDHAIDRARTAGGVSIMVTMSIELDDVQALDLMLRAVGTMRAHRGAGARHDRHRSTVACGSRAMFDWAVLMHRDRLDAHPKLAAALVQLSGTSSYALRRGVGRAP